MARQRTAGLARTTAAVLVLVALAACKVKSEGQLGPKLSVQGVVTDAATGELLPGVRVTLQSFDGKPAQLTSASGAYRFTDVQQQAGLILQFQANGYGTVNVTLGGAAGLDPAVVGSLPDGTTLSLGAGMCAVVGAGTCTVTAPDGSRPDAVAVNVSLAQQRLTPYAGWVYAAGAPAPGAVVQLVTGPGHLLAYRATADATGHFLIPSVALGEYEVVVPPYDQDGDGVADYQFYSSALALVTGNTANLTNQVLRLVNLSHDVEAGSFLLTGGVGAYPFTLGDLMAEGAVGWIQTTDSVFLHFGGEVDPALTAFEVYAWDHAGTSALVPATVTWDRTGLIATIRPATPFVPYVTDGLGYELRITSLFFKDGTIGIERTAATAASIHFTAKALPVLLLSPTPSVSVAGELVKYTDVNPAAAADVEFDSNGAWLTAANGDFVPVPADNWLGTLRLTWAHVAGADHYHVYARNTAVLDHREWVPVADITRDRFDPNLNNTVATVVDLTGLGLGYAEGLRALGNGIDVAVTAIDPWGFESRIDPTRALHTEDTFAPFVAEASVDDTGLVQPAPFAPSTELGSTLRRILRVAFSEPVRTTTAPILTPLTDNLRVLRTEAVGWGAPPAAVPQNSGNLVEIAARLLARGTCSELRAGRNPGDTWIPVFDVTPFAAGDQVIIVTAGVVYEQATVGSVLTGNDPALVVPGGLEFGVPAGAVVCSLRGDVGDATAFPSLEIAPMAVSLIPGTGPFALTAVGGYAPVTWDSQFVTTGTTTSAGATATFTPPAASAGASYTLYAQSGDLVSSAVITITPDWVTSLALNPAAVQVRSGAVITFDALQNFGPTPPAVTWSANVVVGAVPTRAVYTAPAVTFTTVELVTVTDGINNAVVVVVVEPPLATGSAIARVADARLFYQGEPVLVYRPASGGTPAFAETRTVLSVNTATNALHLDAPVSGLQDGTSLVLPYFGAAEYTLRPATQLGVTEDAAISAAATVLTLDGALPNVMVGDRVLVDTDGDVRTTGDQAIVRVTGLSPVLTAFPFPTGYSVTVDRLPVTLRTGQSLVAFLGDAFTVSGYSDTATPAHGPNTRMTRFTANGLTF